MFKDGDMHTQRCSVGRICQETFFQTHLISVGSGLIGNTKLFIHHYQEDIKHNSTQIKLTLQLRLFHLAGEPCQTGPVWNRFCFCLFLPVVMLWKVQYLFVSSFNVLKAVSLSVTFFLFKRHLCATVLLPHFVSVWLRLQPRAAGASCESPPVLQLVI